ncbi:MAG: tRNA (N6-threonylcarbamoyladenosine(37)-N6)-methyltransferase TrmO [Halanaeroarchaeum sp.]
MDTISYEPIGTVSSPFDAPEAVPRPADETVDATGEIVLRERFAPGLAGLSAFSHATVLAHLHEASEGRLTVSPEGVEERLGIFATSGPSRPNPIAETVVEIDGVEDGTLSVSGIDLIDGTPVLDLRPFAPKDDHLAGLERGWME